MFAEFEEVVRREYVTQRRKMIEVALPLEAINKEAARVKSIRHGPSTLHYRGRDVLLPCYPPNWSTTPHPPTRLSPSPPRVRRYAMMDDARRLQVRPQDIPPMVFQLLPWLKSTSPNEFYNASLVRRGTGAKFEDFTALVDRGDGSRDAEHFALVGPCSTR